MTINVSISVNGNYKCPVNYKQGDRDVSLIISGHGLDHPNVVHIPFYHGPDVMTLEIGPESEDNGEVSPMDDSGGGGHDTPPAH